MIPTFHPALAKAGGVQASAVEWSGKSITSQDVTQRLVRPVVYAPPRPLLVDPPYNILFYSTHTVPVPTFVPQIFPVPF